MLARMIMPPWLRMRCLRRFDSSHRSLSLSVRFCAKPLPPRPKILDEEIEENFLKGSGPGGQKINKTSSAVQLKHLPTGIVVKSQATRSRSQNREIARKLLSEKLEELSLGDQSRVQLRKDAANKKRASKLKKSRRKYRALEEAKKAAVASQDTEVTDSTDVDADTSDSTPGSSLNQSTQEDETTMHPAQSSTKKPV